MFVCFFLFFPNPFLGSSDVFVLIVLGTWWWGGGCWAVKGKWECSTIDYNWGWQDIGHMGHNDI